MNNLTTNVSNEADALPSAQVLPTPLLRAVSHRDVAVMFLEWAEQKYWRTAKRVGYNWFKLNSAEPFIDSTADLFDIFIKETEEELSALELSA